MRVRGRYTAKLVRVIDGDTILVEIACPTCGVSSQQRIRLARIDAPEKVKGFEEPWLAAKQYLSGVIGSKSITLVLCRKWPDRYGRLISEVYVEGVNVSNVMLDSAFVELYPVAYIYSEPGDAAPGSDSELELHPGT